jgi:ATP-dependent RNA helicase DDX31/DBP7
MEDFGEDFSLNISFGEDPAGEVAFARFTPEVSAPASGLRPGPVRAAKADPSKPPKAAAAATQPADADSKTVQVIKKSRRILTGSPPTDRSRATSAPQKLNGAKEEKTEEESGRLVVEHNKLEVSSKRPKKAEPIAGVPPLVVAALPLQDEVVAAREAKKFRSKTIAEDPHRYHAKPKDLVDSNTLDRPIQDVPGSQHIFTSTDFSRLSLDKRLSDLLTRSRAESGLGLNTATRVQSLTLPLLVQRQNVLMRSETGSGKTLAYLLPIINDLMSLNPRVSREDGTLAIVIAPTRELCSQIHNVLNDLTKCCVWVVGGSISGGEKKKSEKARLRKGISVLVCTPGRLLDHLRTTEAFDLKKLRWIVFDEADRLLDLGFENSILEILSIIRGESLDRLREQAKDAPQKLDTRSVYQKWQQHNSSIAKRCTDLGSLKYVMASATLTRAVNRMAGPIMGGSAFATVDAESKGGVTTSLPQLDANGGNDRIISFECEPGDEAHAPKLSGSMFAADETVEAPEQLMQYFMTVTCKWRLAALLSFLKHHMNEKVMVFMSTCDEVDFHSLLFRQCNWPEALDDPVPPAAPNGASKSALNPSTDAIEPLGAHFTGIFGKDCRIFRLHGNVPQSLRHEAFSAFCEAKNGIMFCTDVAARGLDLPKVDWIIQYDPPAETTDYVHRIGRTARRGMGGSAVIFLLPSEVAYTSLLHSHGLTLKPLSLQSLFVDTVRFVPGAAKFKNSDEMCAVILQRRIEQSVAKSKPLCAAGKQAYQSFIRAYATHSADSKGIFKVQLLHLGHLAKSFGLLDHVNTPNGKEDTIGKIMNGAYSLANLQAGNTKEARQQARDQKYSLSSKRKERNDAPGATGKAPKKARRQEAVDEEGRDGGPSKHKVKNDMARAKQKNQKLRTMGKRGSAAATGEGGLAPSGRFRKSSGYFKKQLRSQAQFEFSG